MSITPFYNNYPKDPEANLRYHENMQADAARYQWLKKHNSLCLCSVAWGASGKACHHSSEDVDACIDAAIQETGEAT